MLINRLAVVFMFSILLMCCTWPTRNGVEVRTNGVVEKTDTTALLFSFIDSVAHQMDLGNYNAKSLTNIINKFSGQLPLANDKENVAQSRDSIYVGIYLYNKGPYANSLRIYAPEIFIRNITFKKIIKRFGPTVPEGKIVPRPKMAPPVWLDLSKYLENKNAEVSLVISARDFGTAATNPITQIEITNTKLREMTDVGLENNN